MRKGPGERRRNPVRALLRAGLPALIVFLSLAAADDGFAADDHVRPVAHDVFLDGQDDYPEYVFYAYPRDFIRSDALIGSICVPFQVGRPIDINRFNPDAVRRHGGVSVVAVPLSAVLRRGGAPDPRWFDGPTSADVFRSTERILAHPRRRINHDSPARYVSHYRVKLAGKLSIELMTDGPGPLPPVRPGRMPRLFPDTGRPRPVDSRLVRFLRSLNPRNVVFAAGSAGVVLALLLVNRRGRPGETKEQVPAD